MARCLHFERYKLTHTRTSTWNAATAHERASLKTQEDSINAGIRLPWEIIYIINLLVMYDVQPDNKTHTHTMWAWASWCIYFIWLLNRSNHNACKRSKCMVVCALFRMDISNSQSNNASIGIVLNVRLSSFFRVLFHMFRAAQLIKCTRTHTLTCSIRAMNK